MLLPPPPRPKIPPLHPLQPPLPRQPLTNIPRKLTMPLRPTPIRLLPPNQHLPRQQNRVPNPRNPHHAHAPFPIPRTDHHASFELDCAGAREDCSAAGVEEGVVFEVGYGGGGDVEGCGVGVGEGLDGGSEDGMEGRAVEGPLGEGQVGAGYVAAAAVDDYSGFDGVRLF